MHPVKPGQWRDALLRAARQSPRASRRQVSDLPEVREEDLLMASQ
jgi:hypothetical protein